MHFEIPLIGKQLEMQNYGIFVEGKFVGFFGRVCILSPVCENGNRNCDSLCDDVVYDVHTRHIAQVQNAFIIYTITRRPGSMALRELNIVN